MTDPHHSVTDFSPYRMSRQPSSETSALGGPTAPQAMIGKVQAEGQVFKIIIFL